MLNFIQLELEVRPSSHQNLKELRKRTKRTLQVFFLACSGTSMASRICMFRNLCRCSKGSMCSTMVRGQTSPTFRTISGLQDVWQPWHFENTDADKSSAHHRLCNIFWLNKTLESLEIRNREKYQSKLKTTLPNHSSPTSKSECFFRSTSWSSIPRSPSPALRSWRGSAGPGKLWKCRSLAQNWWEIPRNEHFHGKIMWQNHRSIGEFSSKPCLTIRG